MEIKRGDRDRPGRNTPTTTHHTKSIPQRPPKNTRAGGLVQGDRRGAGRAAVVAAAARLRDPPQEDLQALQVKGEGRAGYVLGFEGIGALGMGLVG